MTAKGDFDLYVFRISFDINRKLGLSPDMKSSILYSISFTIGKANATYISLTAQEPVNIKNVTDYEIYFNKEFLNRETIMLSQTSTYL